MNRRMTDVLVAGIASLVLLLGAVWSFQAAQQPTMMNGSMGSMMDGSMGTYGTDPLLSLLAGVVLAVVIAGGYLIFREQMAEPAGAVPQTTASEGTPVGAAAEQGDPGSESEQIDAGKANDREADEKPNPSTERELLRYLPEDERRVLEPVIDSPGVTQIEIRDRADFSKSKVSQTLSELEKRGLVYKEKQGRTFRVYPGEELDDVESA
ncbi:MAG: helix-turn-helix transcriptional regulator [Halodesulfurarchaeum sp.]